jgi:hypothetical protein
MTMIADKLYNMLTHILRGFQDCDAPKICRHLVKCKANITLKLDFFTVTDGSPVACSFGQRH